MHTNISRAAQNPTEPTESHTSKATGSTVPSRQTDSSEFPSILIVSWPSIVLALRSIVDSLLLTRPNQDLAELLSSALKTLLRENSRELLTGRSPKPSSTREPSGLTGREKEVLKLILEGGSSKEIGRRLDISPRTVDVHRARIKKKLHARSLAELLHAVHDADGAN